MNKKLTFFCHKILFETFFFVIFYLIFKNSLNKISKSAKLVCVKYRIDYFIKTPIYLSNTILVSKKIK